MFGHRQEPAWGAAGSQICWGHAAREGLRDIHGKLPQSGWTTDLGCREWSGLDVRETPELS